MPYSCVVNFHSCISAFGDADLSRSCSVCARDYALPDMPRSAPMPTCSVGPFPTLAHALSMELNGICRKLPEAAGLRMMLCAYMTRMAGLSGSSDGYL